MTHLCFFSWYRPSYVNYGLQRFEDCFSALDEKISMRNNLLFRSTYYFVVAICGCYLVVFLVCSDWLAILGPREAVAASVFACMLSTGWLMVGHAGGLRTNPLLRGVRSRLDLYSPPLAPTEEPWTNFIAKSNRKMPCASPSFNKNRKQQADRILNKLCDILNDTLLLSLYVRLVLPILFIVASLAALNNSVHLFASFGAFMEEAWLFALFAILCIGLIIYAGLQFENRFVADTIFVVDDVLASWTEVQLNELFIYNPHLSYRPLSYRCTECENLWDGLPYRLTHLCGPCYASRLKKIRLKVLLWSIFITILVISGRMLLWQGPYAWISLLQGGLMLIFTSSGIKAAYWKWFYNDAGL